MGCLSQKHLLLPRGDPRSGERLLWPQGAKGAFGWSFPGTGWEALGLSGLATAGKVSLCISGNMGWALGTRLSQEGWVMGSGENLSLMGVSRSSSPS